MYIIYHIYISQNTAREIESLKQKLKNKKDAVTVRIFYIAILHRCFSFLILQFSEC